MQFIISFTNWDWLVTCLILFATEGYLRVFIFFEKNRLFKVFLLCQQGLVTTMQRTKPSKIKAR